MTKFEYTGRDNLEVMKVAHNYNKFLKQLAEENILSKKALCLDFGAGSGTFAELLRSAGYTNIECVEPDIPLSKVLKQKGFKVYLSLDKIPDKKVDVAYLFNVLEHIEHDGEIIKAIAKKLKKSGKLIVYVPAFNHLFSSMDVKVEHHRRYTKKMLRKIYDEAGLTIVHNQYYDPMGYFATLAYKLVGSKQGDLDPGKVKFFDKYIFPINKVLERVTKHLFGKNVMIVGKANK